MMATNEEILGNTCGKENPVLQGAVLFCMDEARKDERDKVYREILSENIGDAYKKIREQLQRRGGKE